MAGLRRGPPGRKIGAAVAHARGGVPQPHLAMPRPRITQNRQPLTQEKLGQEPYTNAHPVFWWPSGHRSIVPQNGPVWLRCSSQVTD